MKNCIAKNPQQEKKNIIKMNITLNFKNKLGYSLIFKYHSILSHHAKLLIPHFIVPLHIQVVPLISNYFLLIITDTLEKAK